MKIPVKKRRLYCRVVGLGKRGTREGKVRNASMNSAVTFLLGLRKLLEAVKKLQGRSAVNYMQTNSVTDRRNLRR